MKKWLSAVLTGTMILGSMLFTVSAADKYEGFTDLETAVKEGTLVVEAVAAEDADTTGYTVWRPGAEENGNSSYGRGCFGELNGEKILVVYRYANPEHNPYVTAKVKINGEEYKTVIDMTDKQYNPFFTAQNQTTSAKLENGIEVIAPENFFDSNHGLKTLDLPTELVPGLNLASNMDWAYFNAESEQYETYTIGSELTGYTKDRIVLQGANTSVRTLTCYTNADKNTAKKQICAWFDILVDPNGGVCDGHSETYTAIKSMGSSQTLSALPTKDGSYFNGWTVTNDNINKTVTFTAKWADAPCAHVWEEKIITPATCTSAGSKIKTCTKCRAVENVTVPKTAHSYSEKITKEATCTEDGSKTYTCVNCNDKRTVTLPALGHNFVDGKCTRCDAVQVWEAKIGETKYDTLTEAINAAKDGDTIVLLNNIEKTGSYYTIQGKNITLDLNGKTINAKCSGSVVCVYGSTVTIKDTAGEGAIVQKNGGRASAVYATSAATLILENGKYVSNGQYGAVHIAGKSKCYVSGSILEGDGGNVAVFEGNSEAQLDDVTLNALFNKTYQMYSDGIWVEGASLTINSGVYNGSITAYGKNSEIGIKGGLFSENILEYVLSGYTVQPEGDMYRVIKATAKVVDTAKSGSVEVKLNDLERHENIDVMQDSTYKVIVTTAPAKDVERVNDAITNANDKNANKQVFDVSVVKIDSNGVETDISETITRQTVTLTLAETPVGNVHVYHVKDDGTTEEVTPVTVNGNTVTFTASSFSTYAVTYDAAAAVEDTITSKVGVVFTRTTEGSGEYYIVLKALDDGKLINRFMSADLAFRNAGDKLGYTIEPAANMTVSDVVTDGDTTEYHFEMNGTTASCASGDEITIGKITFTGYGAIDFRVDEAFVSEHAVNIVNTAKAANNIVDHYDIAGGTLTVNTNQSETEKGTITDELKPVTKDLTIKISFPNNINDNASAYQDMTVTVKGGEVDKTYALGTGSANVAWDETANVYTVTVADTLVVNTAYTVTVSGAGYRTARYTVTMTENKTLNFWNNVKDTPAVVEVGKDTSAKSVTFLAGDIVKDGKINIYDLSAVVSYFGTINDVNAESAYAKYDLNRDGKIDSKDVAYVLVSWGK